MKNLILRAITGAVYVALICAAVLIGGWWFIALFSLIAILALNEFYGLSNASAGGENVITLVIDIAGGLILVAGLGCINIELLSPFTTRVLGGTFFTVYLLYLVVRLVAQLYSQETSPLTNLAYSYMGQLYIALPLGLMSMYYTLPDGAALLLAMFIMIWLSDTGAFLVGSMIGRHKLFPRISPGKTWEGFAGGVLFAIGRHSYSNIVLANGMKATLSSHFVVWGLLSAYSLHGVTSWNLWLKGLSVSRTRENSFQVTAVFLTV